MYQITQKFIAKNRSYTSLNPIGIVLHETATPNATALNEFNYFNNNIVNASAHAFIDAENIVQTIPWLEKAWHVGKTGNRLYIGVEMCHFKDDRFYEIYNKSVWLFAYLFINVLKQTIVTKDNLLSHADISNKWHETDHQDPISYLKSFNLTMDDFREDVQNEINKQLKGDVKKVKYLVIYNNYVDKRQAERLAEHLQCPTLDGSQVTKFNYDCVEIPIGVGGGNFNPAVKTILKGETRDDTNIAVLKYMGKL